MSTKAIRNVIIGLIFATLLVPFVVMTNLYFPYIVGKAILFRVIVLIMFVLWSFLILKDSKFLPSKNGVLISFGALNFVYLISALLGPDVRESIFSGFERMDGWITTILVFIFFVITSSVMREKKIWNWFFLTQISLSIILFLGSIGQLIDKGINHRVDTLLGNPIYLSVIFMFSVFFALFLMFEDYSKMVKWWLGISILVNMFGIFITGTRGTMLAVFVSGILLFVSFAIKFWKIKKVRTVSISFLILAILLPILLFGLKDTNFVKNNGTLTRLTQINITEGTGYARFVNWGIAVRGIKERPIIGWGQGGYSYVFDNHYDPRMYAQEPFFDRAHNIILDTTIQGGILGLITYLLIFVSAIYFLFKNQEIKLEQRIVFTGLLLAYFIQNIFVFDNVTSYLLFAYLLAFCVFYKQNKISEEKIYFVIPSVVIVFSIAAFVFAVYLPVKANTNLLKGIQVYVQNKDGGNSLKYKNGLADNTKYYENTLGWNQTGIQEIKISTLQTANIVGSIKTDNEKIKQDQSDFINFAYNEIQNESNSRPKSARMKYFAGVFAMNVGDLVNAEKYLEGSISLAPNRQLYLEGLLAVKKSLNKKDEVFEITKKIYQLETSNDQAWIEYGILLAQKNQQEYSNFLIETKSEKRIDNVIVIFDNAIKKSPENPQVYVNKAVFLSKVGEIEKAIKIFEEIKIKFPTLSKQLDSWIKQLKAGKLPS